ASIFKAKAAGNQKLEADLITVFLVMQLGGVALFTSLAGCLFQNLGYNYVRDAILGGVGDAATVKPEDAREALAGFGSRLLESGDRATAARLVAAVTQAIGQMYYIVVAGGGMMLLCGCVMCWERVSFESESLNIDQHRSDRELAEEGSG